MYNQALTTLIEVADSGSFLRASEKLYISAPAVMKQMNQLEQHIGLPLLVRTNQGVQLTEAGKSLYKDAKEIIRLSREAVERAYKAQKIGHSVVRVGTSALYPCKPLMELWNVVSDRHPGFRLKVVAFTDTATETAFSNIGKKYDLMIGPHNSVNTASFSEFLPLGGYRFCVAVPWSHPLSGKKSVKFDDLHGERLLMQAPGNSPINDRIRNEIQSSHPQITIVDLPHHYDLDAFNLCAEEEGLLLSLDAWKEVHPSLATIPLQTEETIPYGILSSSQPSPETRQLMDILREVVRPER